MRAGHLQLPKPASPGARGSLGEEALPEIHAGSTTQGKDSKTS